MTGRELILLILNNHLEDEIIFKDGKFVNFLTVSEYAAKMNTGVQTVLAWLQIGTVHGVTIEGVSYIPDFSEVIKNEK